MYPMTITIQNAAQLNAILVALAAPLPGESTGTAMPVSQPVTEVKKSTPAPTGAPKAEAAAIPPTAGAATDAAPEPKAESSAPAQESASTTTIDNAKALTLKLVSAKGADFTRALLKEFNVPVAAKLAPEQVGPFITRAEQALAS